MLFIYLGDIKNVAHSVHLMLICHQYSMKGNYHLLLNITKNCSLGAPYKN